MSGAEVEDKLRQEIQRLQKEIEELKAKHKKEIIDQANKLKQEKEQEIKLVQAKFDKQIVDLKAQFKKDQDFLIAEHTKQVTILEEDLKIAR